MSAAIQTQHWLWCYLADPIDHLGKKEHFSLYFKYTSELSAEDNNWGQRMYTAMSEVGNPPIVNEGVYDFEYVTLFALESKLDI